MSGFPSFTSTSHHETYPAIDPRRPELSMRGRHVVITGGGNGIGARMAQAFAEAGAAKITITARREQNLKDVKAKIESAFPTTSVSYHVGDVVNSNDMQNAAKAVGNWDVLVANAGYLSLRETIAKSDPEEWWRSFEVNIKGTFNTLQAFTPTAKQGASIVGVSTGAVTFPLEMLQTASAYASSKLGLMRMLEIYAAENPTLMVKTIHPGVIDTEMGEKADLPGLPRDDIALPANFTVWAASKEADFARGRFIYCNWDVTELKARASELEADPSLLTTTIKGSPFSPQAA